MQIARSVVKQVTVALGITTAGGLAMLWNASQQKPFHPEESIGFPSLTIGDNYLATLQTGDLVFFNTPAYVPKPVKWFLSTCQRKANQGEFEHMGVIVYHPSYNYPYVLEHTWLGPVVSTFEDRIGYSNSQDIIIRTLHMIRPKELNEQAQQFLEDELIKSQNSLSLFTGWLSNMAQFARVMYMNALSPRASSELNRFIPIEELHELLSVAAKPDDVTNMKQKERLAELQAMTSHREEHEKMSHNRVTLYGELLGLLSQLRVTEHHLREHLLESETKEPSQPVSDVTTSNIAEPSSLQGGNKTSTYSSREAMLLLQKRNHLYRQFELKYDEYRQKTAELLHNTNGIFCPYAQGAPPAFQDAHLVAGLLTHLQVLPESKFDELDKTKFDEQFPSTLPKFEHHVDEHDLRQYDFSKIHHTLLQHSPHPREYRPHNFRAGMPLALSRGILGEEQYIVQGFNKPPLEFRTGADAFEEWDDRRH